MIKEAAADLGWHYGSGVRDLARVLRLPGSINRNEGLERPCSVTEVLQQHKAKMAERHTPEPTAARTSATNANGSSVFDKLAELVTWADILAPHGWQQVRPPDAATEEAWKRPGGTHPVSAKVLKANPRVLVVHSEEAGLPAGAGQRLTKARTLAHLNYGGDESVFAKDLVRGEARGVPIHASDAMRTEWTERPETDHLPPNQGRSSGDMEESGDGSRAVLGALLADLRTWQDLPDPTHIIVALAAAATRKADGEPCWVLLVAPPSSGKPRGFGCSTTLPTLDLTR